MKRRQSLFCAILMTLMVLASSFCLSKKSLSSEMAYANIESEYYNEYSIDLLSRNISGNISNGVIENIAPFNTDTKQKMEGYSITPTADSYGQVKNKEFKINDFEPIEGDSIYLWVYLFETFTFELKISITDKSASTLVWEFSTQQVYEMGTGWKLLALDFGDLADLEEDQNYLGNTYSHIIFNFLSLESEEGDTYEVETHERFSFYHIFLSNGLNSFGKSGKVADLSGSFFKFKEDFPFGRDVFIGDKMKIQSANQIFDYLYIGKYDLSNYTSSKKYFWVLKIEDPYGVSTNISFGDTILFAKEGYYHLNIQLYETGALVNRLVLNKDISTYCDEAKLGRFDMGSSYVMKDSENILLTFRFSDNIQLKDNYEITIDNKNAEIDTYYVENGILYIQVSGVSAGVSTLNISAKASSKLNDEAHDFTSSAEIKILSTEEKVDVFMIIIWATFGCFCGGIIIYMTISLVKARKNDVK